ncbi:free fatty acid receptor 2-like [Anolis carolinensis]|uniref:Free fatty acid receptor 1 n=1 Tax=Anolis carolinensis TaxID=28377 RepID=H9GG76_ANOCA|nr:PREDICTED: free fatty acid receptor 2-like [Anolis carolinensis]|eukprot:XP_003225138.1 PREDICTED: free fatty acid receptor 2-like [Anolis carolinensis]
MKTNVLGSTYTLIPDAMGAWKIISLVVYGTTFLLGLPSNVLALYVIYCRAKVRVTPNLIYMINLCISDLVFVLILPLKMLAVGKGNWALPGFFCALYNLIHFGTIYASVCFLTVVGVGRFLGVVFPIQYQIYKKPCYSCLVSLVIWTIVGFHGILLFVLESTKDLSPRLFADDTLTCYSNFTEEQMTLLLPIRLELSVVLFFLPLAITFFCYAACIWVLVGSHLHVQKKRRAVRVAVATLSVFVLCFGPYNISHVVGFVLRRDLWWRSVALLPSACNAFLDPLVFYFLSTAVDDGIIQVWQSLKGKCSSLRMKISLTHGKQGNQQKALSIA